MWLPLWAVWQADLAGLLRSWTLRTWALLSAVLALVILLGPQTGRPGGQVHERILQSWFVADHVEPARDVQVLGSVLSSYVVVWMTFVMVLGAGAVPSELGMVADSVLSRGISRWQYLFGKLASRLCAVLSVYLAVAAPVAGLLWLAADAPQSEPSGVLSASLDDAPAGPVPNRLPAGELSLSGAICALATIGAVLAGVAGISVALGALFRTTMVAVAGMWLAIHVAGLMFALLDLKYFSPAVLLGGLPHVLHGDYVLAEQCQWIASWLVLSLVTAVVSAVVFARRDV